uniref:Regulator of telomere elongation helicase 1 homolog n=1 Tax=Anopheles dirus TaxID=7168 RepID=A0A182N072_9DIPT
MPSFDIRGVSVQFPFEPYEPQKKYMEKVLEGLQKRQNAVLESPAGTGKTLSLLCATLGWLANEKWKEKRTKVSAHGTYRNSMAHLYAENIELTPNQRTMLEELRLNVKAKIIYVCRTHTQASKAMKELKNTSYFPVRALVLGSRDLLCTHPDVAKAAGGRAAKSSLCQQKVKSHTCSFYNRVERTKNRPEFRAKPILDIEDLVSVGGKLMACPYYLSRELIQSADVLFMSYNYLFDAQIHKSNELDVRHSIIIFHEAHNVGKICENSCSTRIRSSDVALAISETTALMTMTLDAEEIDSEEETEIVHSDVFMMEEILLNLQKEIHAIPVISSPNGTTLNGTYIFRLLEKANITFDNVNKLLQILVWQTTRYNILGEKGRFEQRAIGLQTLFDFLKMVYAGNGTEYCQSIERSFRLHIETEEHAKVQSTSGGTVVDKRVDFATTAKVLNFWCVNAGFAMRQLLDANPRNIILTSSALGPLEPFISELAIPVKVTLENPHIVDRSKVCVKVVSHGPDRVELISSELSRANPQYVTSLGRTVLSLCPVIPGGVLVFFPSYPVLNKCVEDWQASGIWAQINRTKQIFVEPRGNESLSSTVGKYYARLREPANRGAIFMAVCRGKVSEGLDFSDANCRAVLITGLPFPPMIDARVVLKKEYLDRNRTKENELISGNDWYGLEASRAVNQAIGRVIRHKDDYGAILLCDSRFQNKRQHVQLTSWIQDHLRDERATRDPTIPNFGKVIGDLSRFYRAQNKSCDSAATASNVSKTKKTREKRKPNVAAPQHNFCSEFRLSDYLIPPSTIACQTSFMTARELFHTQMSRPTQSINFNEVGVNKLYTGKLLTNRESSQVSKASTISSHSKSVMHEPVMCNITKSPEDQKKTNSPSPRTAQESRIEILRRVKKSLQTDMYKLFLDALLQYQSDKDFSQFIMKLCICFEPPSVLHLFKANPQTITAMPEYIINGVPVQFPFEPYELQKNYMAKVIECLQNRSNGVLESPTGTGKTLSLLCSSLAWLLSMKSKIQHSPAGTLDTLNQPLALSNVKNDNLTPDEAHALMQERANAKVKIVYASRTHSQLSQAMQELKNTSYHFVRAVVLGSREQLCIHPDVVQVDGGNAAKTHLCRQKVKSHTCTFHSRVERMKDRPEVTSQPVLDIEDLVTVGRKLKACPYFLAKDLVEQADVLFMPYNYLLDAKARKANGLVVQNSVIILDEAHNVEKMCEQSGSTQIRSTDVALAIEDTTGIIKSMTDAGGASAFDTDDDGDKKEFTLDDLCLLKEILLNVEKAIDELPTVFSQSSTTHPGNYIYSLLEKANITFGNVNALLQVLGTLITYITTMSEKGNFIKRGAGLQALADFLEVVYAGSGSEYCRSVERSFRLHIELEEAKQQSSTAGTKRADGWTATKQPAKGGPKANAKVLNFWCFNPGFGMRQLLDSSTRSIILTSGTLAPLRPLISELALPVAVSLENPHIIDRSQVYVKVVSHGPDRVELNSSYRNRSNPEYIASLGRTVLSLCPVIPGGLLVFFPSYPLLNQCTENWQASGIWAQINRIKPIFVEPRGKDSFTTTMGEYYARLREPANRGAIFMAVCRGKVSEGLDFADANGRAVLITGLPFPPMMDARVVLKKEYLDRNRTKENELITGNDWYGLEASRAVNQAIGRVIRHKDDYGAILLCDSRFQNPRQQAQLSSWIQGHLRDDRATGGAPNFGKVIGELSRFFRAQSKLGDGPAKVRDVEVKRELQQENRAVGAAMVKLPPSQPQYSQFRLSEYLQRPSGSQDNKPAANESFITQVSRATHSINLNEPGLVTIHKRERQPSSDGSNPAPLSSELGANDSGQRKKRKFIIVPNAVVKYEHNPVKQEVVAVKREREEAEVEQRAVAANPSPPPARTAPENRVDFLREVKQSLVAERYKLFLQALAQYSRDSDFNAFITKLFTCFDAPHLFYLLQAMRRFVMLEHKQQFDEILVKRRV